MKKRNPFVDGFTSEYLSCAYCLYYEAGQCQLDVCCCEEEKREALEGEKAEATSQKP